MTIQFLLQLNCKEGEKVSKSDRATHREGEGGKKGAIGIFKNREDVSIDCKYGLHLS